LNKALVCRFDDSCLACTENRSRLVIEIFREISMICDCQIMEGAS